MPWLTDVTPFPFVMEEGYDLVEAKLRELGITKGKVGVDMMKFAMIDKIQRGMPDLELVDGYSVVENAQLVKNPDEIVLLKANAQLADIGMTTMLDHLGEGVTEIECSAAAAHKLMMLGCEDVAYYPLCESGMHSWNTYKYPTTKRMRRGDMDLDGLRCAYFLRLHRRHCPHCGGRSGHSLQKRIYSAMYDML